MGTDRDKAIAIIQHAHDYEADAPDIQVTNLERAGLLIISRERLARVLRKLWRRGDSWYSAATLASALAIRLDARASSAERERDAARAELAEVRAKGRDALLSAAATIEHEASKVECWAVVSPNGVRHTYNDDERMARTAASCAPGYRVVHLVEQRPWLAQLVAAWRGRGPASRDYAIEQAGDYGQSMPSGDDDYDAETRRIAAALLRALETDGTESAG